MEGLEGQLVHTILRDVADAGRLDIIAVVLLRSNANNS